MRPAYYPARSWVAEFAALALLSPCFAACKSAAGPAVSSAAPPGRSITVTCTSFRSGGAIPVDFTCDGSDRSPELTLSAPPPETRSLAVVVDDADAPGGNFTHWIAYNLAPETAVVREATDAAEYGGATATNDFQRASYGGPCPPRGDTHRYRFRVFALDAKITLDASATRGSFDAAVRGHVLAEGALTAVYGR
jgi:Raf kinase inhibitor-like YbhB/YbcL family protein